MSERSADSPARVAPPTPTEKYELYEPCGARCMGARCTKRPNHDGPHRDAFEAASWEDAGEPCGASWTADYGALPCDLPRGHQSKHRTYSSQGEIRFADDCPRAASPVRVSDTERLDWWFANGLSDSVCEGSVDIWWATEIDGDATEVVTHGTSIRDALDKAMRGEHDSVGEIIE